MDKESHSFESEVTIVFVCADVFEIGSHLEWEVALVLRSIAWYLCWTTDSE
jgi:hypothetical protein